MMKAIQSPRRNLQKIIPLQARTLTPRANNRIAVSTSDGIEIFDLDNITHATADGNYSYIHGRDGRVVIASKTLKTVETAMQSNRFVRIHQSHLVSLYDIKKILPDGVVLENGIRLSVSRGKRPELLKKIESMMTYV